MIRFDHVTTRRDDRLVLDDVSVTIAPDEFVLIVGANGAGKSTLLQHVNGILTPDSGTVSVAGQDVTATPLAARRAVGMVFQEPRDQLVGATVADDVAFGPENLGLAPATIDERVADALAAVGMTGAADRRIDSLSHGERTRVAIAGALAMDPQYLVLDEPLVGLDAPSRKRICGRIEAARQDGSAVLLATHDVRQVFELTDRVIGLAAGEVVLDAPPSDAAAELASIGVQPPPAR